jgi:hypothetical protein
MTFATLKKSVVEYSLHHRVISRQNDLEEFDRGITGNTAIRDQRMSGKRRERFSSRERDFGRRRSSEAARLCGVHLANDNDFDARVLAAILGK